jgi:hypothetical protein
MDTDGCSAPEPEPMARPWPCDDDVVILQNECPARVFALLRAAQRLDARVHGSMALFLYANAAPEHRGAKDLDALLPRDIDFVVPLDAEGAADDPVASSSRIHDCVASEMARWVGPDSCVKVTYSFFRRAEAAKPLVVDGYSGAVYVHHVYVNTSHMADFTLVAAKERRNLETHFACTTVAAQCGWEVALVRLVAWEELLLRLDSLCAVRKHAQRRQLLQEFGITPRVLRRVILAPPQVMLSPEEGRYGSGSGDSGDGNSNHSNSNHGSGHTQVSPLSRLDVVVAVAVAGVAPVHARLNVQASVAVVSVAPRPRRRLHVTTVAHVEVRSAPPAPAPAPAPVPRVDHRAALAAIAAASMEHVRVMAAALDRTVCERLTAMAARVNAVLEQCCAFADVAAKCHAHAKAHVKSAQVLGALVSKTQPKGYAPLTERMQQLFKVLAANGIEPFATIVDLDGACFSNGDTMRTLLRRVILDSFFVFQRALAMQLGSAEAACSDARAVMASVPPIAMTLDGKAAAMAAASAAAAVTAEPETEPETVFQTNFLALAQGVGNEVMRAHRALASDGFDADTDDDDGSARKKEVKSKKGGLYSAPFNDGLTHVFSIKTTLELPRPQLGGTLRSMDEMTTELLMDDELGRLSYEPALDDFGVAFTCVHTNAVGKLIVSKFPATANAAAHAVRPEDLDEVKAMRRHLQELKQGRVCFHTMPGTEFFSLECIADTLAQFCIAPSLQLTHDMHNDHADATTGLEKEIGLVAARAAQDLMEAQRLQSICRALRRTCSTFSQARFVNVAAKGVSAGRRRRR